MGTKQVLGKCSACGGRALAVVSQHDFIAKNRFTGEWTREETATVKLKCLMAKNPVHQSNAGYLTITWDEFAE
ncbi:hypothetical protein GF380_00385 [Candidatus Uhrbacteria bacterium]|nr:hypothetical protein [Candidatus Uhrbacteria bacterium]